MNVQTPNKFYIEQNWKNVFVAFQDMQKTNNINPYKTMMAKSAYGGIKVL